MLNWEKISETLRFDAFLQRVHPGDREKLEEPFKNAAEGPFSLEYRTHPELGPMRHLRSTVCLLKDDRGHPVRALGCTVDISGERQLFDSCARLAALVESSGDAIVSLDLEGRITSWNPGAKTLFGFEAEDVLGQPASLLVPVEQSSESHRRYGQLGQGQRLPAYRAERLHADGSRLPVSIVASPICDDRARVTGVVEVVRDLRPQLLQEQEVARLSRLYAALSQVNQAIVLSRSRQELLEAICRALVAHGGFQLAWVGWPERESDGLVALASAGEGLASLDTPAEGAAASAYREQRVVLLQATCGGHWASLPLTQNGTAVGVLSVLSEAAWGFQEREVALLSEAASDLSYGLEQLQREEQRVLAERKLREEGEFTQGILESLPGVLYCYDEQGRFLRWNRRFETVTGYSAEEIACMHPLDFFSSSDQSRADARIQEVFQAGESSLEADFITRSGERIPYFFTGLRVELGGRSVLVGVGIDVSERQAAQGRYRSLFTHAPDGILIADCESYYRDANPTMCEMLGYRLEELIGKHALDILDVEEVPHLDGALRDIQAARVHQREWRFRRKDGSCFPAEVISTRMPDGFLMGMIRDISERKAAEQALVELNQQLERRVEERTHQLSLALERAESADRLKSVFLATMSHELRTPLNSILGFTSILLKEMAGPLNPEQSKQLGMVHNSARHLLALINDVLDLSKIEANQLEVRCQPFALETSLQRTLALVAPLADKKGLTLSHEIEPGLGQLCSDSRRVEQMLINLLQNAIKFTDNGKVLLRVGRQPGNWVQFEVIDTGIGIRPEEMRNLFLPFRQIDSGASRQHEGTGLGLVICHRLVDLLGGDIGVDSRWQSGSRFWFRLPFEPGAGR